jgi:hypothetical protein
MSITITGKTSTDHHPDTAQRLLDALCAISRRWRARLGAAPRFLIAALTLLAIAACEVTGGTATAGLASSTCPGSISLTWFITNASGQFASCAQVGATSVALRLQSRTGGTPVFTAFPCASSPGTTNVPPGLYDVAIALHDANGRRLATAPTQTSVAIAIGRTKVLTPVVFAVGSDGGGNASRIALTLEAENVASNCQLRGSGGAGITGTTITLARVAGGCAAVTLVRNRGGVPIGTYQINCSSPEVAACIERDETLTSAELEPDSYVMRVRGKIGAVDCWAADPTLVVPSTGQLQTKIVLRRQSAPGC